MTCKMIYTKQLKAYWREHGHVGGSLVQDSVTFDVFLKAAFGNSFAPSNTTYYWSSLLKASSRQVS
eukprot:4489952-Amphidinium_carterae.1